MNEELKRIEKLEYVVENLTIQVFTMEKLLTKLINGLAGTNIKHYLDGDNDD